MKRTFLFLLSTILLISCVPRAQPSAQTGVVAVYATSAAQPWMSDLFACANELSIIIYISAEEPDISLRIGEPETLTSPAFQIGEEEILIVTHRESPVQNLTLTEVQALFAGQGDAAMQVWVYSSDEDVQIVFDQLVMKGRNVTSFARVAASPQEMSDVLNSESNSIGFLPKRWVVGNVRMVYSAGMAPVLAVTNEKPQGVVSDLVGCLQND